jgi:hypothetical protein
MHIINWNSKLFIVFFNILKTYVVIVFKNIENYLRKLILCRAGVANCCSIIIATNKRTHVYDIKNFHRFLFN